MPELIDPADCSPPDNPDNVTYGTRVTLESDISIAYAVLSPMAPVEFDVLGQPGGRASQSWWMYAARAEVVAPHLQVTRATDVPRGTSITCTTSGFRVVGKWTFTPDASNLPVVSEVANRVGAEWKGQIVAEGTVTVDGWVNVSDFPDEAKKKPAAPFVVKVNGRGWKDTKLQLPGVPQFGGPGTLPDGSSGGIITWGRHVLARALDFTDVQVLTVTDGPNLGYKILTASPKLKQSTVYLNPAIDGTSAWAKKQTGSYKGQTHDVNGDPICTTAAIALLKPHVERHEGLTGAPAPDSHWGIWQDQFGRSGLPATWESLVRTDDSLPAAVNAAYSSFVNGPAATAAQDALDNRDNDAVQKGWRGGCIFIP